MKWVLQLLFIKAISRVCLFVNNDHPTSIEGELPEERLFRKYAHKIRNWNEDKQEKF